jgi:hypothetical protein
MGIARDDVESLADRLLERRRPWTVIDLLTVHLHGNDDRPKPSPDLIQRALRGALEPNLAETFAPGALDYALRILLDRLAAVGTDPDVMFELEWAYLPLLEYTRKPRAIYERLAEDPDLFVDLVCYAFGAKATALKFADLCDLMSVFRWGVVGWSQCGSGLGKAGETQRSPW